MTEYTQGICMDGAAILKDGEMMTIEEILDGLRELATLKASLPKIKADAVLSVIQNYVDGPITAELTIDYLYEQANKLEACNE